MAAPKIKQAKSRQDCRDGPEGGDDDEDDDEVLDAEGEPTLDNDDDVEGETHSSILSNYTSPSVRYVMYMLRELA